MVYWLAVGPVQNWGIGLARGVWGLPTTCLRAWEKVQVGDIVLFYATAPARGIIGHGVIASKRRQRDAIWPEEVEIESALWPLRLYFDTTAYLPQECWETRGVRPNTRILPRRGFQLLKDDVARELLLTLKQLPEIRG